MKNMNLKITRYKYFTKIYKKSFIDDTRKKNREASTETAQDLLVDAFGKNI